MFSRRQFMRMGGALGALSVADRFGRFRLMSAMARQTAPDYRALVCIFLVGGNDSNNLIVPMDSEGLNNYTSVRQQVALEGSSLLPIEARRTPYGLHPNLPELQKLYNGRQLAILVNVGTLVQPLTRTEYLARSVPVPENLLSHSGQQIQWQSAVTTGSSNTGWAGRTADIVAPMNAPSIFPTLVSVAGNSLFGNGAATMPATIFPGPPAEISLFHRPPGPAAEAGFQQLLTLDTGVTLIQAASQVMSNAMTCMAKLGQGLSGAKPLQTSFPDTTLGAQLKQIAQIIQVRDALEMNRQIFYCALDGFDTHSGLISTQAHLFAQLSQAMTAFFDATQELGVEQNVTTFTESEFGRTLQPTGSIGSDHGWGGHHLILGGAVKGGDIYGTFPSLIPGGPDDSGIRGTWIPTTSLDQYGATLASWFGVGSQDLVRVFPNVGNFRSPVLSFL